MPTWLFGCKPVTEVKKKDAHRFTHKPPSDINSGEYGGNQSGVMSCSHMQHTLGNCSVHDAFTHVRNSPTLQGWATGHVSAIFNRLYCQTNDLHL